MATEEYLSQLKEKKYISAFILNLDTSSYDEIVVIDESMKDESLETKKKELDGPKSNYFWIKSDKGFKKASRWEIAFQG